MNMEPTPLAIDSLKRQIDELTSALEELYDRQDALTELFEQNLTGIQRHEGEIKNLQKETNDLREGIKALTKQTTATARSVARIERST